LLVKDLVRIGVNARSLCSRPARSESFVLFEATLRCAMTRATRAAASAIGLGDHCRISLIRSLWDSIFKPRIFGAFPSLGLVLGDNTADIRA